MKSSGRSGTGALTKSDYRSIGKQWAEATAALLLCFKKHSRSFIYEAGADHLRRSSRVFLQPRAVCAAKEYQGYGRQYYSPGPNVPSEFYWSRLHYTSNYASGGSYGYRRFREGWSQDYPKADNDCLIALRRLTHINSPSPLNVADLDSDHIFDYPWIYSVNVENWTFTDAEAKRLHDYLMKGGFLMVDHFHGTQDWERFMQAIRQVLPDQPVEDLQDSDEIFHVLY